MAEDFKKTGEVQSVEEPQDTCQEKDQSRREFLAGLGKWSKVVIGAVLLGGAASTLPDDATAKWHNGGGWSNKGGWHNGGWHNGGWHNGGWHNGGWHNGGGGGWWNGGGGGWWNGGWYNGWDGDGWDNWQWKKKKKKKQS